MFSISAQTFSVVMFINLCFPRKKSFRASLVVQMIENLPAMQEAQVQSLGWEDPLEKGMTTHSSVLPRKSHGQRAWWCTVQGVTKSLTIQLTD